MMPFTLNILSLMRDYNGSHSERAVPTGAHLSADCIDTDKWRAVIRDWLNISHRGHSPVMKFPYSNSRERFHNVVYKKCMQNLHSLCRELQVGNLGRNQSRVEMSQFSLHPQLTRSARRARRTPRRSQPCRIRKTLMIINCRIIQQKALSNGISLNL